MQQSSVRIGWKVMFGLGVFMVVMGLLLIFIPKAMFAPDFTSFTGESWSDFLANNPKPAGLFIIMQTLTAHIVIMAGLFFAVVAWHSYSRAEKWSWYTLLATGIIGWASSVGYYIIIGELIGRIVSIVTAVIFVIGIVLPAKAILGKKST